MHLQYYFLIIQVYELLHSALSDFDFRNWTSSNRSHAGFPSRGEGRSDFEYYDGNGELARLLKLPEGLKEGDRLYLLEVKSTESESRSFHLSRNQFALVPLRLFVC
jgi:hypothetical protein